MRKLLYLFLPFFIGCTKTEKVDLLPQKQEFINKLFNGNVEEGPFKMFYSLKTILFSEEVISLFGELDLYTNLPHSSGKYEGKTYCKINNKYKEITLNMLFNTPERLEYLKTYCENNLKQQECSYFSGEIPLRSKLETEEISTFVVDDQFLIVIFQPYIAGSYVDGPFFVKISYEELQKFWDPKNPLAQLLPIKEFVLSWDQVKSNETSQGVFF